MILPISAYSGMIGSGLCIFSKISIEEALFHKFDLNGYAHKVHHGDWFGGKGVGLVKLSVQGFHINFYITHVRIILILKGRFLDSYFSESVASENTVGFVENCHFFFWFNFLCFRISVLK